MHYFKRNILDLGNLLLIGLPLIFIFTFHLVGQFENASVNLDTVDTTVLDMLIVLIVLGFQFYGADNVTHSLHHDFKGSVRARLFVTGTDQRIFFLAVIVVNWLYSFVIGMLLVAITTLFFHVDYWGNYSLVMLVILFLSLLAQLVGVLIFYFTKDKKSAASVVHLFGEVMQGTSFIMFINLEGVIGNLSNQLPIQLGLKVIEANSIISLIILLGYCTVLSVMVFFIGRRRHYV
jgi:hypothetical protein